MTLNMRHEWSGYISKGVEFACTATRDEDTIIDYVVDYEINHSTGKWIELSADQVFWVHLFSGGVKVARLPAILM